MFVGVPVLLCILEKSHGQVWDFFVFLFSEFFLLFSLHVFHTCLSSLFWLVLCLHCKTHSTYIHASAGFEPAIPVSERPQAHAITVHPSKKVKLSLYRPGQSVRQTIGV